MSTKEDKTKSIIKYVIFLKYTLSFNQRLSLFDLGNSFFKYSYENFTDSIHISISPIEDINIPGSKIKIWKATPFNPWIKYKYPAEIPIPNPLKNNTAGTRNIPQDDNVKNIIDIIKIVSDEREAIKAIKYGCDIRCWKSFTNKKFKFFTVSTLIFLTHIVPNIIPMIKTNEKDINNLFSYKKLIMSCSLL